MTSPNDDVNFGVTMPPGARLALDEVWAVAVTGNVAHQRLGTRLVAIDRCGATLEWPWREDLVVEGRLPNGVVATLLDHACSLASLVALDDVSLFGGTMGLRVEYLRQAPAGGALIARARCHALGTAVAHVAGSVFPAGAPETVIAIAACSVAVMGEVP
jgi:acyl-coenzyme A thioesterase PaaI-like protein